MIKNYAATILMLCVWSETGLAQPFIAETTASASATNASHTALPDCWNSASDIADIRRVQKANGKTSHKYDGYRRILHTTTAAELAARLAYAETVAANCATQQDQVIDLVTAVIGNRIRIRRGDVESVIFQKDQFASSLNIYSESRYRDFLCPKDGELWKKVLLKMRVNLEESQSSVPIPQDTVNYYLYQHSKRFKEPTWKLEEAPITDVKTRECIGVFRDPSWK